MREVILRSGKRQRLSEEEEDESKCKGSTGWCKYCETEILDNSVESHFKGIRHSKAVKKYPVRGMSCEYCPLCHGFASLEDKRNHDNSAKHILRAGWARNRLEDKRIDQDENTFLVGEKVWYRCDLCESFSTNYEHEMQSARHKELTRQLQEETAESYSGKARSNTSYEKVAKHGKSSTRSSSMMDPPSPPPRGPTRNIRVSIGCDRDEKSDILAAIDEPSGEDYDEYTATDTDTTYLEEAFLNLSVLKDREDEAYRAFLDAKKARKIAEQHLGSEN